MNLVEQRNRAVAFLKSKSNEIKTRPWAYTAKEVAHAINGDHGSIGRIALDVVAELQLQGIEVSYLRLPKPCRFRISNIENGEIAECALTASRSEALSKLVHTKLAAP